MEAMDLGIPRSYNARLFTQYRVIDRDYVILFHRDNLRGPFFVSDAPYVQNLNFHLGEIHHKTPDGKVVGDIFYTKSPFICEGTFAVAYSGILHKKLNSPYFKLRDMKMELILKSPHYYAYNAKNEATLLVSPSIKEVIRKNFEV